MLLSDLFEDLKHGDLHGLSMVDDGCISPEHYPRLISATNQALTELHKRFQIKLNEVIIQQYEHISVYTIHSKYAESNTASTENPKYIKDSVDYPYQDDLLVIEQVFDEVGNPLFLNDSTETWSVYTPSYNKVQVILPDPANQISVVYRANHPKIPVSIETDPEEIEIDIPMALWEALQLFIAYKIYSSTDKLNGSNSSNNYLAKFEAACNTVDVEGLILQDDPTNMKARVNGWV